MYFFESTKRPKGVRRHPWGTPAPLWTFSWVETIILRANAVNVQCYKNIELCIYGILLLVLLIQLSPKKPKAVAIFQIVIH